MWINKNNYIYLTNLLRLQGFEKNKNLMLQLK